MLAQTLQIAVRRLAAGFERNPHHVECIQQAGHHVRGATERRDQFGAFFVTEAHGFLEATPLQTGSKAQPIKVVLDSAVTLAGRGFEARTVKDRDVAVDVFDEPGLL